MDIRSFFGGKKSVPVAKPAAASKPLTEKSSVVGEKEQDPLLLNAKRNHDPDAEALIDTDDEDNPSTKATKRLKSAATSSKYFPVGTSSTLPPASSPQKKQNSSSADPFDIFSPSKSRPIPHGKPKPAAPSPLTKPSPSRGTKDDAIALNSSSSSEDGDSRMKKTSGQSMKSTKKPMVRAAVKNAKKRTVDQHSDQEDDEGSEFSLNSEAEDDEEEEEEEESSDYDSSDSDSGKKKKTKKTIQKTPSKKRKVAAKSSEEETVNSLKLSSPGAKQSSSSPAKLPTTSTPVKKKAAAAAASASSSASSASSASTAATVAAAAATARSPAAASKTAKASSSPAPKPSTGSSSSGGGGGGAKAAFLARKFGGGASSAPSRSSADLPNGRPGCLNNLKFVVTGVMDLFGRENIEETIVKYGGKCVSAISGKTNYLVTGNVLEDGRSVTEGSKYRAAVEKKVKIISETDLIALIAASNPTNEYIDWATSTEGFVEAVPEPKKVATAGSAKKSTPPAMGASSGNSNNNNNGSSSKAGKPIAAHSIDSGGASHALAESTEDMMWVDKYKPKRMEDLIGSNDIAKKLGDWLRDWDAVHIHKTKTVPHSKELAGARAALVSGPPGVGKTTVVTLLGNQLGYEILELNASDTRSKKSITEMLADVVLSSAIDASGGLRKRMVIMDEVDGMGGSDRGGIPELIKIIKTAKNPIVCICNDRQSQKIRSLANYCYDLRVRRPTKTQIASRIIAIARQEGLQIEQNAAEMLVEQTGNDIRQVLHCLQMWKSQSSVIRVSDMKENMSRIEKDKVLRQSPFDATLTILGGDKTSIDERYNSFFIDYSLIPLMVQQNYIDSAKNGIFRNMDECAAMDRLADAASAVSDMELASASIMGSDQHWELLPATGMMAVRVGSIVRGFQPFPAFPQWLGKNSSANKGKRLAREVTTHTSLSIDQNFLAIRLDYVPYMRFIFLEQLRQSGSESNEAVLHLLERLDQYGLSKEDFSENMKDLQFVVEKDSTLPDLYAFMDTKTKSALTRIYNASDHRSQSLSSATATSTAKKGRGGGGGGAMSNEEELEVGTTEDLSAAKAADEEGEGKEEEDAVGDMSAFQKKSRKGAGGGKAAGGGGGGGGGGRKKAVEKKK